MLYKKNFASSKIKDYTFKSKFKPDQEVIVFGMCSMYNHSNDFKKVLELIIGSVDE